MVKLLFPEKLNRLPYLFRIVIFLIIARLAWYLFSTLQHFVAVPTKCYLIIFFAIYLLQFPCLAIPRLRSMGWSPWCALLLLVPLVNFVIALLLLFIPPKET